jgi:beta-glucuronidase
VLRNRLDTSGLWLFELAPREEGEAPVWFRALPAPRPMAVPGRWNDLFADARDSLGLAWYLTGVWVRSAWRGMVRARQSLNLWSRHSS